jgi:guanylate kinase
MNAPTSELSRQTQIESPTDSVPLLMLISAPSGGGKTTLCQELLAARPGMTRVVTCTTRRPRPGEQDGRDYHFLGMERFMERVRAGCFIEHAMVYGNRYGTLKSDLIEALRLGKDVLLVLDVQGAATMQQEALRDPELSRALVSVFLTPPSIAVLEARLRRRGTDAPEVIAGRLSVAREEIAQWERFDYLILSSSIGEDLRRMEAIVEAEKLRSSRAAGPEYEPK